MLTYITRRLVLMMGTVFVIVTIVFIVLRVIPGDPVFLILGNQTNETAVKAVRAKLGLDKSMRAQYMQYLFNLVRLDLGRSIFDGRSVNVLIAKRLPRTAVLVVCSLFIAAVLGIFLGIVAAVKRGSLIDTAVSSAAVLGLSSPVFVIATFFILAFAIQLQWLPCGGYIAFVSNPTLFIKLLVLPSLSLATPITGIIARLTRSGLLDVLGKDYITVARSKGLVEHMVLIKHALRNSLIPVITVIGIQAGSMIGGSVIIESIFNWPGVSSALVYAVQQRDYPVIQGVMFSIAIVFMFINLLVDIGVSILDPRIRYD